MRTFHNLDLLKDVMNNPSSTIGQRNYGLYNCYKMSYDWGLELVIEEELKDAFEKMPSIEEFVTHQLGENNGRTVLFDYYIGWNAEDQRELFDLCCQKILEYEKQFPAAEGSYSFELKDGLKMDLKENLRHMLIRPAMYGMKNLSYLRAFVDGLFRFKKEYNLKLSNVGQKLCDFAKDWKTKINPSRKFETWDRPFRLERMGTTDFHGPSVEWEFERFEQIITEDLNIKF